MHQSPKGRDMNHQPNHQSPNAMAVARQAIQTAASESVMAKAFEWGKQNADVMAWIDVNMGTEFADSLAASLNKYGSLTDNQCRAVRAKLNVAPAPEITVAAIEATFEKAKANGVKKPVIRLDTFVFKPAGESSANAGGIYVTEKQADGEAQYLGKAQLKLVEAIYQDLLKARGPIYKHKSASEQYAAKKAQLNAMYQRDPEKILSRNREYSKTRKSAAPQ